MRFHQGRFTATRRTHQSCGFPGWAINSYSFYRRPGLHCKRKLRFLISRDQVHPGEPARQVPRSLFAVYREDDTSSARQSYRFQSQRAASSGAWQEDKAIRKAVTKDISWPGVAAELVKSGTVLNTMIAAIASPVVVSIKGCVAASRRVNLLERFSTPRTAESIREAMTCSSPKVLITRLPVEVS